MIVKLFLLLAALVCIGLAVISTVSKANNKTEIRQVASPKPKTTTESPARTIIIFQAQEPSNQIPYRETEGNNNRDKHRAKPTTEEGSDEGNDEESDEGSDETIESTSILLEILSKSTEA